jgi:hypothetical protein
MIGLPRFLLWLAAISFIGIGIGFLVWPDRLGALVEMPLISSTARIDFVATYGGFQLGFGIFLALCARRPELARLGLLATGCGLAGFACGRIYGLATAAGAPEPIIYLYLALEVGGTTAAFVAARAAGRATIGSP